MTYKYKYLAKINKFVLSQYLPIFIWKSVIFLLSRVCYFQLEDFFVTTRNTQKLCNWLDAKLKKETPHTKVSLQFFKILVKSNVI